MVDRDNPIVQRRRLGRVLRRLRLDSGLTVQQVAEFVECSSGKISRIETADVGARIGDVRDLLDLYKVCGAERERVLELVRQSRRRTSWWHAYAGVLPPEAMRLFGLEGGAASIDDYGGEMLIPDLLRTDGYTRADQRHHRPSHHRRGHRAHRRASRQAPQGATATLAR